MPPTQTDRELAERIDRLSDNLTTFQGQVLAQLGEIRTEIATQVGGVRQEVAELRGALRAFTWVVGLAFPIFAGILIAFAATLYQQGLMLGRLAHAVESLEQRADGPRAEAPGPVRTAWRPAEHVGFGEPPPKR